MATITTFEINGGWGYSITDQETGLNIYQDIKRFVPGLDPYPTQAEAQADAEANLNEIGVAV